MKILNFGSLNYDYVYTVDHILEKGETEHTSKMEVFCGGKGLNQSIALAKAGAEVYQAGQVGEDGDELLRVCKEAGVDTRFIKKSSGRSGHTIIQVEKSGQNSILLYGGSNQEVSLDYMDEVFAHFQKGDLFLMQNEINDTAALLEKAYAHGLQVVLNPSPFDDVVAKCDFSKVSIFLLNEIEGWQISGQKEPEKILGWFSQAYPQAQVVLTMGSEGAVYQHGKEQYHQSIYPVQAIDTTGAGDTFTGYFLAGMMKGETIPKALDTAAKASSIAVSRNGAASSIPWRKEVEGAEKAKE